MDTRTHFVYVIVNCASYFLTVTKITVQHLSHESRKV